MIAWGTGLGASRESKQSNSSGKGLDNWWSDGRVLRDTGFMTKFDKGDKVVAAKDIGGFAREHVPKGSVGYVTDARVGRARAAGQGGVAR